MKTQHINRYNDVHTFTDLENGNVLWEGNFQYHRCGFPNDYTQAYQQYLDDNCNGGECVELEKFKELVHEYLYDGEGKYIGPSEITRKYVGLVKSIKNVIDMVDPSGGPYMSAGMEIHGKIIKEFKYVKEGYEIIVEK